MTAMLPLLALLATGPASADEKEADTCLRTKIWSQYDEGYAVRTATTTRLENGAHRVYLVTLYQGNEYRLYACGDGAVSDLDLILVDSTGKEVARDKTDDREPMVTFKPASTETFYVVVHAAQLQANARAGGVAMAVTYK